MPTRLRTPEASWGHYEGWVEINNPTGDGQDNWTEAEVYPRQLEEGEDSSQIARGWIVSEHGKEYRVGIFTNRLNRKYEVYPYTSAEIFIDSHRAHGQRTSGRHLDSQTILQGETYVGKGFCKVWTFAPLLRTEETGTGIDTLELGTVRSVVLRAQKRSSKGAVRGLDRGLEWSTGPLSEKIKKGALSSMTILGKQTASRTSPGTHVVYNPADAKKGHYSFVFHYSTKDLLMANGIIPGAITPQRNGARNGARGNQPERPIEIGSSDEDEVEESKDAKPKIKQFQNIDGSEDDMTQSDIEAEIERDEKALQKKKELLKRKRMSSNGESSRRHGSTSRSETIGESPSCRRTESSLL